MKQFIEKLIERLEEEKSLVPYNRLLDTIEDKPKEVGQLMTYQRVIEIVNQLAEEYNNDFCEWTEYDYKTIRSPHKRDWIIPSMKDFKFCTYCGKKIKVVK